VSIRPWSFVVSSWATHDAVLEREGIAMGANDRTTVRKLVLEMGMSLDGLVARPGRHGAGGWGLPPEDPALKQRKVDWLHDAGLHLMGRVTYEEMAEFWPVSDDAYAAKMNEIPKVVFSKTLQQATWPESRIARADLSDEIGRLKSEPGKDMIAWGGAAFAQSLIRLGLVDEYRLVLQPVALGDGLPLFNGLTTPLSLELIEAVTYANGSALHVYRPRRR
jgi:dihydrofolate reductase